MNTRRHFFLKASGMVGSLYGFGKSGPNSLPERLRIQNPDHSEVFDEDIWHQVKQAFTVSPTLVNLNNGGVCPQPRVVQQAVEHYNRLSNETPSYYMWRILDKGRESIREKLAGISGCDPEELAINRNASEALETVIFGLRLQKGDEVVLSKQDYPNMINAWKQREHRDGIILKWVDLELPSEDDDYLMNSYLNLFSEKTKVVHLTHVINWMGQILPVKKIADVAHQQGLEVVIDAAHSFAHLPYSITDLGGDYMGTSLHKWLCAPFGSGMLWVKREKIKNLYPLFASGNPEDLSIRKFENLGTRSFAIEQGIGHAIDFHLMLGAERKFKRLHFLKNYWMDHLSSIRGVQLHTSKNPAYGGAIGFFSMEHKKPDDIAEILLNKFNVHTVSIQWEKFSGVRVTPNVYTLTSDLDRFIKAVKSISMI